MRRSAVLASAVLWSALALMPAHAAPLEACKRAPDIVAVSDFIIARTAIHTRKIPRDRVSDDAAYLKIRYGGIKYADAMQLLSQLAARPSPPALIDELRLTYAVPADREALLAKLGTVASGMTELPNLKPSTLRAMILEGQREQAFVWLSKGSAAASGSAWNPSNDQPAYALALNDLSDDQKLEVAAAAEKAGLVYFAARLLQQRDDLYPWMALIRRTPQLRLKPDQMQTLYRNVIVERGGIDLQKLKNMPPEMRQMPIDKMAMYSALGQSLRSAALFPRSGIIVSLQNMTGKIAELFQVTIVLDQAFASARYEGADPDDLTRPMIEGIDKAIGRASRLDALRNFQIDPDNWGGVVGDTTNETIDIALARNMFAPFVLKRQDNPPERSASLSDDFPWNDWVAAATVLREDKPVSSIANARIAFALTSAVGRTQDALGILAQDESIMRSAQKAHILLISLDFQCSRLLSDRGLAGLVTYRFGPRSN